MVSLVLRFEDIVIHGDCKLDFRSDSLNILAELSFDDRIPLAGIGHVEDQIARSHRDILTGAADRLKLRFNVRMLVIRARKSHHNIHTRCLKGHKAGFFIEIADRSLALNRQECGWRSVTESCESRQEGLRILILERNDLLINIRGIRLDDDRHRFRSRRHDKGGISQISVRKLCRKHGRSGFHRADQERHVIRSALKLLNGKRSDARIAIGQGDVFRRKDAIALDLDLHLDRVIAFLCGKLTDELQCLIALTEIVHDNRHILLVKLERIVRLHCNAIDLDSVHALSVEVEASVQIFSIIRSNLAKIGILRRHDHSFPISGNIGFTDGHILRQEKLCLSVHAVIRDLQRHDLLGNRELRYVEDRDHGNSLIAVRKSCRDGYGTRT